jgi:HEAT repeat protein
MANQDELVARITDRTRGPADRIAAFDALGGPGLPKAVWDIVDDESDDLEVRKAAVRAIGRSRWDQLTRRFHPAPLRAQAVAEMERIAREPLVLEGHLQADLKKLRQDLGADALSNLGRNYGRDRRVIEVARSAARDERPLVRWTALSVLAEIGEIDDLIAGAGDPDIEVRARIAFLLGFFSLGRPADVAALERLTADPDPGVAQKARSALRRLGVRSLPVTRKASKRTGDPVWIDLLERIATRILSDREEAVDLPDEFVKTGWFGTQGATADELASLERRLGL